MESSSQLFGGTEECCSSESGWTTYIASSLHCGDTAQEGDHEDADADAAAAAADGKDRNIVESDDSMTSDASTGPNHGEGEHHDKNDFKHDKEEEEDDKKYYAYNKAYRQQQKKEKQKDERRGRRPIKQESVEIANSATSSVNSSVKVRKGRWIEKGK